jgi:hypothetical protein
MKKKLYITILFIFLLNSIGCEVKTVVTEPVQTEPVQTEPVQTVIKSTIPFNERRFIYNNGLAIEQKEFNTTDENKVQTINNYQVISGLKDKLVEEKINKELKEVSNNLFTQLESELSSSKKEYSLKYKQKRMNSYISYSFNNVIFVEFYTSIETIVQGFDYSPTAKNVSYGYDLNTGERIVLADLFKPGFDYKTKINNFICQYLIENNYDDYEAERMVKPFQGIKENQSFSFGFEGLRIILDEKNDEFFNNGYYDQILIPLKYLGDDLYIFDKYFDESESIFEKQRLIKKPFPNQIEFKVNNVIQEGGERYFIEITQGEFINIPNKEIQNKLNEMVKYTADLESFKEKAKAIKDVNLSSHFVYFVNLFMNSGGYISVAVSEEIFYKNVYERKRKTFNYDFNLNKELVLQDLFVEGTDIKSIIKSYISNLDYILTEEMVEVGVAEAVSTNNYYFDEYGVSVYFSPAGSKLDEFQKWIWIPYEKFGVENISLFK